jgi:DnaJ-domain-containing protein 1
MRNINSQGANRDREITDLKAFVTSEVKKIEGMRRGNQSCEQACTLSLDFTSVEYSSNVNIVEKTIGKKLGDLANASSVRDALEAMQSAFKQDLERKMDRSEGNEVLLRRYKADEENINKLLKQVHDSFSPHLNRS